VVIPLFIEEANGFYAFIAVEIVRFKFGSRVRQNIEFCDGKILPLGSNVLYHLERFPLID
jgi:hypothetical protein